MKSNTTMKDGWYKITKYFRGGSGTYAMRVTEGVRGLGLFWDEESLADYVGAATTGGHNYGYSIYVRRVSKKPAKAQILSIESRMQMALRVN